MADVLLITRISRQRENTGEDEVYRTLHLFADGKEATIDRLRQMASGDNSPDAFPEAESRDDAPLPPVLTPFYIEEYLRRREISARTVDCLEDSYEQVEEVIRQGVSLIAVSTTWSSPMQGADEVRSAVAKLRKMAPDTPIIVGGMCVRKSRELHAMLRDGQLRGILPGWIEGLPLVGNYITSVVRKKLNPHFFLMDPRADRGIDAMVVAEFGEEAIVDIVRAIQSGRDWRSVPNLALPQEANFSFTERRPEKIDIDSEIVDWGRYWQRLNGFEAPLRSSTGCPFKCKFCDFRGLHSVKMRSLESMMAEIRSLAEAVPDQHARIFFVDDNLAVNRARLASVTQALIDSRLKVSWKTFLRVDAIDEDAALLMKESGCEEVYLGIESGDPDVLRNMGKRLDPDHAVRAIAALDRAGIRTMSTFVVGFPGETRKSIENTAKFISAFPSGPGANAFHCYYLFGLIVAPLSLLSTPENRKKFKLRGIADRWSHATMNSREVPEAIKELFLKVKGPSHTYKEKIPAEWEQSNARRVMEIRDEIQKDRLRRGATDAVSAAEMERLLEAVKQADKAGGHKPGDAGRIGHQTAGSTP